MGSSNKTFGGGEQAALGRAPALALPCHPPVLGRSGQSGPWHLAAPPNTRLCQALTQMGFDTAGAGVRNEK